MQDYTETVNSLLDLFFLEHGDDGVSSIEHAKTNPNKVMLTYRKDELRKKINNGVTPIYADSKQVKAALSAAESALASTTVDAIDDAIAKCDVVIKAYGATSPVSRDMASIRNSLSSIKRLLS